eukprot:scaffold13320_cov215-Alexandrium_tamarense.AAC.29
MLAKLGAFSGGGISGAIGAACAWSAIVDTYPSIASSISTNSSSKVIVSTVSGGNIGYGLWVNARDKIRLP